jgi:hypothetical protein
MPSFMIQLTHDNDYQACARALHALQQYGSHFVTHADWGCKDGVHTGWLIADVESRAAATAIVPPEFRHEAVIVKLNRFTPEEIGGYMAEIEKSSSDEG